MSKKRRISISNNLFHKMGDKESLCLVKSLGVDAVDFFTNSQSVANEGSIYTRSDSDIIAYYTDIREYAESIGLEIGQTHGRLRTYMNDPALDGICIENARRDLLAAKALGAPYAIMHGVTTSEMGADAAPELMRDLNFEVFSKIIPYAKEYGVVIASETFGFCSRRSVPEFFANAEEFRATYDRISSVGDNGDFFKLCIDTGHTNSTARFDGVSVGNFIRKMGDAVVALHLHDNNGEWDQHQLLMTGTVDWEDTFRALSEIGYSGTYNLEVGFDNLGAEFMAETAAFEIKHLRYLLDKFYGKEE